MNKLPEKRELSITYEPTPTKKNIDYMFQRLVTPLIASTGFNLYEESHGEFKAILEKVMTWIVNYANTEDLSLINWNEFIEIRQKLFELDSKYLPQDGCYAEEAYEWSLQLQILLEKLIKERNDEYTV